MDQAMPNPCEHWYASHIRGGQPVSVRICRLCDQVDWDDLREQVERLVEEARVRSQNATALRLLPPTREPSAAELQEFMDDFQRLYPGVDPTLPALPKDGQR